MSYYWNGSNFPSQSGLPVLISQVEFEACCCGEPGVWETVQEWYGECTGIECEFDPSCGDPPGNMTEYLNWVLVDSWQTCVPEWMCVPDPGSFPECWCCISGGIGTYVVECGEACII